MRLWLRYVGLDLESRVNTMGDVLEDIKNSLKVRVGLLLYFISCKGCVSFTCTLWDVYLALIYPFSWNKV